MEAIQISIPQDSSTKTGEYELKVENGFDVLDLLAKSRDQDDVYIIVSKFKNEKDLFNYEKDIYLDIQADIQLALYKRCIQELSKEIQTSFLSNRRSTLFSNLTYSIETPEKREENSKFEKLKSAFQIELKKYSHYIQSDRSTAIKLFTSIAEKVAKITYEDYLVELAPTNSFKIKLLLKDNSLLVISKPFHEIEDLNEDEIVFSIFEGKKCLITNSINILDLVKGINGSIDN